MKPAILAVLCAACWFVTAVNSQACSDGDVRVQGGPSDGEGRPEICKGTVYYQICDDGWSQNDATVFCRKLGYSVLGAQAYGSSKYGSSGIGIDATNYNCAGSENTLGACSNTVSSNCGVDNIAGVLCNPAGPCVNAGFTSCCTSGCNAGGCFCDSACHGFGDCCSDIALTCPSSTAETACTTNEVRAVGGYTDFDGRVEFCIDSKWTTVCNDDNSWGTNEARVACSQLGKTITNPVVYTSPIPYGQGDYGITVKSFDCVGTESGLNSCSKTLTNIDCGHQNDVGVDCNGPCTAGNVLIVGGPSALEGQVIYCNSGSYAFISDKGWGSEEAQVVCRSMAYSTNQFNAYSGTTYGSSLVAPTLSFECDGNENSLSASSCGLTTITDGDVNNVASVRCYEKTICENAGHDGCCVSGCNTGSCYCDSACHNFGDCCEGIDATCPSGVCTEGDVRLVDGPSENEGRVEVCQGGQFGPVCDNKWGVQEANLVCNQLGYPTTDSVATTGSYFPQSDLTFVGGGFVCAGDEDTLADCTQDDQWSCGHSNEAGVRCPVACNSTGSIRLVGGDDAYDGRVEICEDGIWKSICQGTQWSQEDATVTCNQLGFATTAVVAYGNSYYGQGIGPIAASNLQCTGSESNIYDCTNSSASTCDHTTDVGVDCVGAQGPCILAGFTSCCTSGCNQGGCYCDSACYVFNDCCSDISLTCPQSGGDDSCTNDDIRISAGDNANKGLVELCVDNAWTSICDDGWDNNDAAVACNQAGFSTLGAVAVPGSYFGQDGGPIKKGNFQCTGTEDSLVSCTSSDSTCAQHKIAGVVCPEKCTVDGDIRLIGGSDDTSGYVEVCTGGSWTAICDDGWCQNNAKVVCGQLGYSTNRAEAYGTSYFGQDLAAIQFTNVQCDGDEGSIVACTNSSTVPSTCNSQSLAGVQCFEKSPCEASFDTCCSSGCNLGGCYCDLACHGFGDCCDNIDNICPSSSSCTNGIIRLSGGQDEYEGLLEICVDGKWGTICNDEFGDIDAVKACSQLKLPTDNVHVYEGGYLGQGTNPVVASGFLCGSQELNLMDCAYVTDGFCCGHQQDVAIRCTPSCDDGQIRLDYGNSSIEGTVKVCINGGYKAVCDDQWSNQDATVVCRQLEFSALDAHSYGHSIFNNASTSTPGITSVVCDGTESNWLQCQYSDDPMCTVDRYAGVRCSAETVGTCEAAGFTSCCTTGCNAGSCYCDQICHFFQDCCEDIEKLCPNDVECTEGEVRIVNDFSGEDFAGRVEVCINGKWGSICDDGWGINEAHVVCAQFGFTNYGSVPAPGAVFGQSSFQIVGSNFTCSGFEDSVYDCSYSPSPDCGHHEDAGVYCNVPCSEGDVRMVNSTSKYEGRVEVCNNGTWHPVCEELWSTQDAQVVCRHFGFSAIGAQAYGNSLFGMGLTPTSFVGYNCTGSETNLTDCQTLPATMCDADNTAGVRCSGDVSVCEAAGHTGCCVSGCNAGGCFCDAVCHSFGDCCDGIDSTCPQSTCTDGDVRLIDGVSDSRGRVETCVNGQWGTVCDNGWDDKEARTICGQLGYPINGAAAKSEGYFGQGNGDIVATNFQCTGSEDTLLDCEYSSNPTCGHQEDAGVICPESCTTLGELRLADGSTEYEGRIEMCMDYQWSSVCADDTFCSKSTSVLCKQMGYSSSNSEAYGLAKFGEGGGLVGLEALNCLGTEANISQCQYTSGSSCSHAQDAGVVCKPLSPCELAGHTSCCTSGCYNSQFFCYCDSVCHFFNDCCDNIEATCPGGSTCLEGEKRLSKGNDTSGILYVCSESQWRTVCGINFGDEEAKVACKSQGLDEKGFNVLDVDYYGQGEGQVFAKDLQCTGDESYLTDCPGNGECCSHNKDVGLTCMYACVDGEVRLVGGSNANEGRVEVCYGGRWGTVCDDFWGEDEARVACKMAGLPWRGAVATNLASFGQGVGPIHLDNVDCDGSEGTLWNCSHILTDHNCAHFEDAGAICAPGPCELSGYTDGCCDTSQGNDCQGTLDSGVCHCDAECEIHGDCCVDFDLICKCEDNDIRLINGANEKEGRVEICANGQWGTVCDDFFGIQEGQVVCRQLGYPDNTVQTFSLSYFGQGTGPIWLDNLNCVGNESKLIDCPHLGIGTHNCIHFEDASVRCADPQCTDGETRLMDGDSQYAGRLEVCLNKQWGSVCDDLFGVLDAKVACKSLSLPYESADWFRSQINFPAADSSLPINLDNVQCTGDEDHILDCNYVAQHNCIHFEDVAVVCNPSCSYNGELRLTGGTDETNGRLEVCHNNQWGTVCDDFFDNLDAKVACRQLGLPTGSARSLLNLQYGRGYGDINYSQLQCTGNETHLVNCSKLTTGFFCSHAEDVAISCEPACQDGQIKLVGGKEVTEGRVEVCRDGYWGTICDNSGYFGIHEARVVCRQLGFPITAAQVQSFGPGGEPLHFSNLNCDGSELNVASCSKVVDASLITCTHVQDVGVTCEEACSNGDVRLVDGSDQTKGRFEVCLGGTWGTVCDDEFHNIDAKIVCKQLGLEYAGAEAVFGGVFGIGEDSIAITTLHCEGNEDAILDCFYQTGSDVSTCSHANDVGIICQGLCGNGDIRLSDGTTSVADAPSSSGRVEVCFNGEWGTVCDNGWSTNDAQVTCGQLGYDNQLQFVRSFGSTKYGAGIGEIFMTSLTCSGSESCLVACPYNIDTSTCTHDEDAGVRCNGEFSLDQFTSNANCFEKCTLLPGMVQNLTITLNPVEIRWDDPVVTNGIITGYNFTVADQPQLNQYVLGNSPKYLSYGSLSVGVPYTYTLYALNLCGPGPAVTGTFFTGELVPNPPTITRAMRTSGKSMSVSWMQMTLAQARGNLIGYEVSWASDTSSATWSSIELSQDISSYTILSSSLEVDKVYQIRLRARNSAGYSGYSTIYKVNTTDSVLVQVKLFLQSDQQCGTWLEDSSSTKTSDLVKEIADQVSSRCSSCGFTVEFLVGAFQCNPDDQSSVHFRGQLYATSSNVNPTNLAGNITDWLNTQPKVTVDGVLFDVDDRCTVIINTRSDDYCVTSSAAAGNSGTVVGVSVAVVIVVLIVFAGLVIVIVILVLRVRPGKYGSGDASHEVVGYSNQMAFPDGGEDNISQRASSTIHDDDFQHAINMISDEVDEKKNPMYDEPPSGVTFSGDRD